MAGPPITGSRPGRARGSGAEEAVGQGKVGSDRLKIASMIIGASLFVVILAAAFIRESMSPSQVGLVRTASALAAGMVAAGIAGYVTVSGSLAGLAVRAGGPMAIVVLVLYVDPADAVAQAGASPERKNTIAEINALTAGFRSLDVTVESGGVETKLKGPDAVKEIVRDQTKLDPDQLARSASTDDLRRVAAALRSARASQRANLPRFRPPPIR